MRLALPILAKHKIPPSPLNLRMDYDYVAGNNEDLIEQVKRESFTEPVTGIPNREVFDSASSPAGALRNPGFTTHYSGYIDGLIARVL